MSVTQRPPIPSFIPETAPFSVEQRAWLNGLFAGVFGLEEGVTPLSSADVAELLPGFIDASVAPAAEIDDSAPWHDPAMALADRMKLAEGRTLPRRMMAAMAQQDCGQCGYNCHDYSQALFAGNEERLNLCVPGGKDTARMLKQLYQEISRAPAAPKADTAPIADRLAHSPLDRSRDNPAYATFLSRRRINKTGSQKETWHVEFDLSESDLDYTVGDSFGIFPANDPALVGAVIAALDAPPDFPIGGRTLREVLADGMSLSPAPDMLFQLMSYLTGGDRRQKAKALAAGLDPDGDAAQLDVLAALQKFPGVRPDPEAFIESLDALQPRVYSISSSLKCNPGRVALTVDAVRYEVEKRTRLGVASTFLAGRVAPGERIKVYVQKAQHFALPRDPKTPIIMVGPGTGVAPFRAFLQERQATKAPGRNWLFFGHQRSNYDFFYEDELLAMRSAGLLTRLTLAWSRDADEKIYVQHRMREVGRDLWAWLAEGAHFYICGDATRMARDVERTLVDVIAEHGARTPAEAVNFLAELKKLGRYQTDVY
ncbi:MAG TPA: sulfite reductase subunit alpha [Pseudolabrys sp.]